MATTSTSNAGSLLSQASAMVAQTQAQGSTPFAGSSYSGGGGSNIKQETRYGQSGYVLPSGQWVNAQYASPDVAQAFKSGTQYQTNPLDVTAPITAQMLNQQKIAVPATEVTETQKLAQTVGQQNAQQLAQDQMPRETRNLIDTIGGLFAQDKSSQQAFGEMFEASGLKQSQQRINELRNQIALQTDFLNAGLSKIGNETISTPIIGKQQRLLQEQQGRKIALLSAQLEAEQGNFNMAKDLVNMQYQAWKTDSDRQFQVKQLVLNQLERYENQNFEMYKMKVANDYTRQNDLEKTRATILSNYYSRGGKAGSVATSIGNATTMEELLAVGGKYTMSALESQQLENARLQGEKLRKEATPLSGSFQQAQIQQNVQNISNLVESPYIRTAVGPTILGRFVGRGLDVLTGQRQNYVAGVEQLRSQLTVDSLISAKERGATFGALSEGELGILSASASKLGTWAIKDKSGNVTGYRTNESDFRKELDKINNFAKLDYVLKGGTPQDVGIIVMPNGKYVTKNSDGTYQELN